MSGQEQTVAFLAAGRSVPRLEDTFPLSRFIKAPTSGVSCDEDLSPVRAYAPAQ
jgi:hypothetical protein